MFTDVHLYRRESLQLLSMRKRRADENRVLSKVSHEAGTATPLVLEPRQLSVSEMGTSISPYAPYLLSTFAHLCRRDVVAGDAEDGGVLEREHRGGQRRSRCMNINTRLHPPNLTRLRHACEPTSSNELWGYAISVVRRDVWKAYLLFPRLCACCAHVSEKFLVHLSESELGNDNHNTGPCLLRQALIALSSKCQSREQAC